jgi:integrase
VAKRRNAIDLTLFQAGSGLRISEALQITLELLEVDDEGVMHVNVTREIAKTGVPRRAPVADPRITEHLMRRLCTLSAGEYLIGAPVDSTKRWPTSGSTGATASVSELYKQLATDLAITLLEHPRSHVWRTPFSSQYEEAGVPREHYVAVPGHDE